MTQQSNKQLVLDMYTALNSGDSAGYFAHMRDDVQVTFFGNHRFSRTFNGKKDIMENFVPPLRARLDGSIRLHVKNVIADGEQVVVEAQGEARTKDGLDYNNLYCIVLRLQDGKVAEIREYTDTALTKTIFG
jgi:ketosteroid isomerase-like protein